MGVIVLSACASFSAFAQSAPRDESGKTQSSPIAEPRSSGKQSVSGSDRDVAEEAQLLANEIQLLEQRKTKLELEKAVKTLEMEVGPMGRPVAQANPRAVNALDQNVYGIPLVQAVEGLKGKLEAVLIYRGSERQRVREGDVVYGARVARIAVNEVQLVDTNSGVVHRLQFGSRAVTESQGASAQPTLPPGRPGAVIPEL